MTSITVNNDNESVRNKEVQEEIATGFDANAADNDSDGEDYDDCSDFSE